MKRLLFLLGLVSNLHAAPFLESNSYPSTTVQPDTFTITGIGTASIASPAFKNSDGSVLLKYDLSATPAGSYNITVVASYSKLVNGNQVIESSVASSPFSFSVTVLPAPSSILLSPN